MRKPDQTSESRLENNRAGFLLPIGTDSMVIKP